MKLFVPIDSPEIVTVVDEEIHALSWSRTVFGTTSGVDFSICFSINKSWRVLVPENEKTHFYMIYFVPGTQFRDITSRMVWKDH